MLWKRGRAYAQDLRERVFAASDAGLRVGQIAEALKNIYRAVDASAAEAALIAFEAAPWGQKYPAIGQSWRRAWPEVIPFCAFPVSVRRLLFTTNAIESLNAKIRRAVRAKRVPRLAREGMTAALAAARGGSMTRSSASNASSLSASGKNLRFLPFSTIRRGQVRSADLGRPRKRGRSSPVQPHCPQTRRPVWPCRFGPLRRCRGQWAHPPPRVI